MNVLVLGERLWGLVGAVHKQRGCNTLEVRGTKIGMKLGLGLGPKVSLGPCIFSFVALSVSPCVRSLSCTLKVRGGTVLLLAEWGCGC